MSPNTADDRTLAEIPGYAVELERELDRVMVHMTSCVDLPGRQIAAGALARCRALIEGIRLLADPRPDLCGLLLRNLAEAFVVGVLALYDDQELKAMLAAHQKSVTILNDLNKLDLDLDELIRSQLEFKGNFNVEQATKRACELLRNHGDDSVDSTLYDLIYRAESTFGGHGLGLATPYVDGQAEPLRLIPRPGSINVARPEIHLGWGCICTCFLARHVLRVFGISGDEIETILDRLGGILVPEQA